MALTGPLIEERSKQSLSREHAGRAVKRAIRDGKLVRPKVCPRCGKKPKGKGAQGKVHAHHPNYRKPLKVVWLCPSCHTAEHVALRGNNHD